MKDIEVAPKKILFSILVNLGDVVLFTAAAAALKQQWPQAHFSVLVRKAAKDVVENNPLFDEVIVVDYKTGKMSYKESWQFIKRLKAAKYDLAICFDQKLRSMLYLFFAAIPRRILVDGIFGTVPLARKWLATEILHTRLVPHNDHGVLHFLDIAAQMLHQPVCGSVSVGQIEEHNRKRAKDLLTELAPEKKRVALCVKGTFPLQDWQPEKFAELIRLLTEEYNVACFIVGGPGDKAYADLVISAAQVDCKNFCGQTSIIDMAALFELSNLLITVCTGTVHVASTTTVPAIVVYGCTVPRRWHPLQERYLPVWSMRACSPCTKKPLECPEKFCLQEISVQDVLIAAAALLQERV